MQRLVYVDWLRIIATVAVVVIHVSASIVHIDLYEGGSYWFAGNFYESLARWSVPIFVMVSGALLLSDTRDYTFRSFLVKRVSKVFIPLVGWSFIYYLYFTYQQNDEFSLKTFIVKLSTNDVYRHFWFIYMILGLYLITPILKVFLKNAAKKDVQYFLLLWLYISVFSRLFEYLIGFSFEVELYFATNFVGYYILGYYLLKYEISKNWRKVVYIGGILGFFATFFLTYFETREANGSLRVFWYDYHSLNVVLVALALFVFFKYNVRISCSKLRFIPKIVNNTSFGIYLVHMLVIRILNAKFPYILPDIHPILGIPYKVTLTIVISTIIVLVMKRIPVLRKLVP